MTRGLLIESFTIHECKYSISSISPELMNEFVICGCMNEYIFSFCKTTNIFLLKINTVRYTFYDVLWVTIDVFLFCLNSREFYENYNESFE